MLRRAATVPVCIPRALTAAHAAGAGERLAFRNVFDAVAEAKDIMASWMMRPLSSNPAVINDDAAAMVDPSADRAATNAQPRATSAELVPEDEAASAVKIAKARAKSAEGAALRLSTTHDSVGCTGGGGGTAAWDATQGGAVVWASTSFGAAGWAANPGGIAAWDTCGPNWWPHVSVKSDVTWSAT